MPLRHFETLSQHSESIVLDASATVEALSPRLRSFKLIRRLAVGNAVAFFVAAIAPILRCRQNATRIARSGIFQMDDGSG